MEKKILDLFENSEVFLFTKVFKYEKWFLGLFENSEVCFSLQKFLSMKNKFLDLFEKSEVFLCKRESF